MIETPKFYSVSENRDYQSLMNEYIDILEDENIKYFLSEKTSKELNRGSDIIPFDSYNPENFLDFVHLSLVGRKMYSSELHF